MLHKDNSKFKPSIKDKQDIELLNNNSNFLIEEELNNLKFKYIPEILWPSLNNEKQLLIEEVNKINNILTKHNYSSFINKFDLFLKQDIKESEFLAPASAEALMALKEDINKLISAKSLFIKKAKSVYLASKLDIIADAAEEIIFTQSTNIFQRARKLVCVTKAATIPKLKKNLIDRNCESFVISEIDSLYLTELLSKLGYWSKYDSTNKTIKLVDNCPDKFAKHLMVRPEWKFRVLKGFINAPILRADGTILDKPGYDEETGLLFISENHDFEPIPKNPNKEDAANALKELEYIVKDFIFENDISKSVAISAMITAVLRKSLVQAPIHCFTAPMYGSGKSLLCQLVSYIATGKPVPVLIFTGNDAEDEKRITSVLMSGDPIICYDNVDKPFLNRAISALVTNEYYQGRQLNFSKTVNLPNNVFVMVNGNNLELIKDSMRRTIVCKIDPGVENPEDRKFDWDVKQYVLENRSKILRSILTIPHAYNLAGRPNKMTPLGSFEDWSDLIRSALIWLGMSDPCISIKETKALDPENITKANILRYWWASFNDKSKTVKEILDELKIPKNKAHKNLKEAFLELAPTQSNNQEVNIISLVRRLGSYKNHIADGYKFEQFGRARNGSFKWKVVKIPSK